MRWSYVLLLLVVLGGGYYIYSTKNKGGGWFAPSSGSVDADLVKVFAKQLVDTAGRPVSATHLRGKVVGLYFSAHWCPPCRAFTPKLVAFRDANSDNFEVVFVSFDKDEKAKSDYMEETMMKWATVPFDMDLKRKLASHYQVEGIPALVIVDAQGKLITLEGRAGIERQADASLASWRQTAGLK